MKATIVILGIVFAVAIMGDVKPASAQQGEFDAFARAWWLHGFNLIIDSQGTGYASWRAGWCAPGQTSNVVVGCDSIDANGRITNGGEALITFRKIDDATIRGIVTRSNGSILPVRGSILLIRLPHDMLLAFIDDERYLLCGADYVNQAPPELLLEEPCGA